MGKFKELEEWIENKGESLLHSSIDYDNLNNGISLSTLKEFERAYLQAKPKLLFAKSLLVDLETYMVDLVDSQSMIEEIKDEINKRISVYNESLQEIDYTNPYVLHIYFMYEGIAISYSAFNEDYLDMNSSEETYEKIKSEVLEIYDEEMLKEIRLKLVEEAEEALKEITDFILRDEEFHSSTNGALRMKYMSKLFVGHPEYRDKISAAGYRKSSTYSDYVWKLYKESKKI